MLDAPVQGQPPQVTTARLALDFNLAPLVEMDPSWVEVLGVGAAYSTLSSCRQSKPWLAQHLLDTMQVSDVFWTDFSRPRARLALLDGATLQRVLLYVGVCLRHDELRGELDGAVISRIRASIGEDAFEFAIGGAPLIAAGAHFERSVTLTEPRLHFMVTGAAYAIDPRAARVPAYLQRLSLRLPKSVADGFSRALATSGPCDSDAALPPLVRRIVTEIAEPWLPFFD
ncbi:MAG: SctK family type III secretion system sorting platform protein [Pseudomonadota bacterium]